MPSLSPRLRWLEGVTAYGSSRQGGTRAAFDAFNRDVIGGPLNMRRAFTGLPEPADGPTCWSTKSHDANSIADRHAAFAAYGRPAIDIFHHEPDGWASGSKTVREYPDPGIWRARSEAVLLKSPANVGRGACFMSQSARDGRLRQMLPTKPAWLDLLLFDPYPTIKADGSGLTVEQQLGPCAAEAARLGVPWGIAEWGLGGPGATATRRIAYMERAIEWVCDDKQCLIWLWFNSSVGAPNPVYDGTSSWEIQKSSDRHTPELAEMWREMAKIMRAIAQKAGSPAVF